MNSATTLKLNEPNMPIRPNSRSLMPNEPIDNIKPSLQTSTLVYISGPIAHYDIEERRQAFQKAETMLARLGFTPVNPMKNGLPQPGDWRQHMRVDIRMLLSCHYIYFLPDWQLSKGCRLELDVAMSCGLQVLEL